LGTISFASIGVGNLAYNCRLLSQEALLLGANPWWWKLKLKMFSLYFNDPPYLVISREGVSTSLAQEDLIYGETPLLTVKKFLEHAGCAKNDVFYDLGCGRGNTVFFVSKFFNIDAVGVDILPTFIRRANEIKNALDFPRASFIQNDFLSVDISPATIVYIASTTFTDSTLQKIIKKTKELNRGTRLITLSAPLNAPNITLTGSGIFYFSWGKSHAFFHTIS